jgi:putative nucleotidyltransferase with HDIG domain
MNQPEKQIVLIADDDPQVCRIISDYLSRFNYKTVLASNGRQALELFHELKPHLVLIDLQMPVMDGMQFLEASRKTDIITPVIIITGHPDVSTAIKAMQSGAFDYLIKPVQLDILYQKITQAIKTRKMVNENALLTELASLHDITVRLTNTHDLPQLLAEVLDSCIKVSNADSGSVQLINKATNELLIVQQREIHSPSSRCTLDDDQSAIAKWVIKHGTSLLINGGSTVPDVSIPLKRKDIESSISVPLKVLDETIGVINLNHYKNKEPFAMAHLNVVEVLAAQAGIAINNSNLYSSVNQKLADLSLICNYSARLMGLVEKNDIIQCFFETIKKHFPIDVIGYLTVEKRTSEFAYWSRLPISYEQLQMVCDKAVETYEEKGAKVQRKKIALRPMASVDGNEPSGTAVLLAFHHTMRMQLEGADHGVLYFGAAKSPDNVADKIGLLSSLINQTTIALTNSRLYNDMKENYIKTIKALAIAVDAKDTYTHGHSENVCNLASEIAEEMGLDQRITSSIRDGALLHDIGKIGIPGYILNKPGALTHEEFNGIMKTHATLGANIVKDVPFLKDLYELILYHHENFNGSGYPDGLKGDEIPLGARIVHVADAFEAMTSNRPYRNSLGKKEAFRRLTEEKGNYFDPRVVEAFFALAKKKGWLNNGA